MFRKSYRGCRLSLPPWLCSPLAPVPGVGQTGGGLLLVDRRR